MTVLARLEQEAEVANRKAARLNRIVELARELGDEGLSELTEWIREESSVSGSKNGNGHAAVDDPDAPRGRKAVRIIVRERPGLWTLAELREEMQRRGWYTSASGLEAATKRLCDINHEGRHLGPGRYEFPANHGKEGVIESDVTGAAMIASP